MSHKIPIITPHHLGFSSCVTKCKVHVGLFLYLLHSYRITVKYVNKDVIIGITFLSYKIGWRLWKVLFHQATSKRWISVISLLFFTYHRIWVGVKSSEAVKPGVKKHFLSKKLTTPPDVTLQNVPCRDKKGFLNRKSDSSYFEIGVFLFRSSEHFLNEKASTIFLFRMC